MSQQIINLTFASTVLGKKKPLAILSWSRGDKFPVFRGVLKQRFWLNNYIPLAKSHHLQELLPGFFENAKWKLKSFLSLLASSESIFLNKDCCHRLVLNRSNIILLNSTTWCHSLPHKEGFEPSSELPCFHQKQLIPSWFINLRAIIYTGWEF